MRILLLSLLLLSFALPVCASPIKGITVFQAINEERKGSHLRPLAPDATLVRLAQQKADDMERRKYFAHSDPNGLSIMRPEWKGYLILQVPDEHSKMNRPYIYAVCAGGEVVPAVLNNLDLMAEDWLVGTDV